MGALLLSLMLAAGPFYDNVMTDPSGGVVMDGGAIVGASKLYRTQRTTDAAAYTMDIMSGAAYGAAAVNTAGGDLRLCAGIGNRQITVSAQGTGADTYVGTLNGTNTTLTAGVTWQCITSNAVCAANLRDAINASALGTGGVTASCSDATCTTPTISLSFTAGTVCDYLHTINDVGGGGVFGSVVSGNDGVLRLRAPSNGITLTGGVTLDYGGLTASAKITSGTYLEISRSSSSYLMWYANADQGMAMALNGTDGQGNNHLALVTMANYSKALGTAAPLTNPSLSVFSAADMTADTTQYIRFAHDQTNGVISTGKGMLDLQPTVKAVRLPVIDAAVPAEPFACGSGTVGSVVYVNDNNDAAAAVVCLCAGITNDATYDWVRLDNQATACPFF